MKSRMMAVLVVMVCAVSVGARAENPARVASVDLNRIQNEIGYQRLVFIETSDEVKAEVLKLRTQLDQILVDSLKEEEPAELVTLQAKIQAINNKLNIIRNAMSNRSSDYRKSLTRFISSRYAEQYALIVDAQMARSSGQLIVWKASEITDLTDDIIRELDRELP